jgi:hypothetical protein
MNLSENIAEFAKAFAAAQGMMRSASKDASNPFFKSSYSTLASVIEAIREPFASNGLSFSQPCKIKEDGSVIVETIIMHSSGQYIIGEITGKPVKNDPQAIGSLVSYLKRYLLQAMAGIASADDDAESAVERKPTPKIDSKEMQKKVINAIMKLTVGGKNLEQMERVKKELSFSNSAEIYEWSEDQCLDALTWIKNESDSMASALINSKRRTDDGPQL